MCHIFFLNSVKIIILNDVFMSEAVSCALGGSYALAKHFFFFFGIIQSSDLILCLIVINTKIYGSNISVVV